MTVRLLNKDICLQIAIVFDRKEEDERELLFYIPFEMFGETHEGIKCNGDLLLMAFVFLPTLSKKYTVNMNIWEP